MDNKFNLEQLLSLLRITLDSWGCNENAKESDFESVLFAIKDKLKFTNTEFSNLKNSLGLN